MKATRTLARTAQKHLPKSADALTIFIAADGEILTFLKYLGLRDVSREMGSSGVRRLNSSHVSAVAVTIAMNALNFHICFRHAQGKERPKRSAMLVVVLLRLEGLCSACH